jgi:hypothetical protein
LRFSQHGFTKIAVFEESISRVGESFPVHRILAKVKQICLHQVVSLSLSLTCIPSI